MANKMSLPSRLFRNYRIPARAKEEYFEAVVNYAPQPRDIFIVSYPKCGTTWTQHIVYLLHTRGKPASSVQEVISLIPFPEQDGYPDNREYVVAYKYHLPFQLMPQSSDARYIYVARNPKDACVSYYYFLKNLPGYEIKSFDDFVQACVAGNIPYGDIMDHFLSWYEVRNHPNVLFLMYEDLSKDRLESVARIAEFLGFKDLPSEILNDVVKYSSFEFMKSLAEGDSFMSKYLQSSTHVKDIGDEPDKVPRMMRKGIVGDWKNHFSDAQSQLMDDWIKRRLTHTDLLKSWKL